MTNATVEKRRFPRVPLGISMDITAQGLPNGRLQGEIRDLSQGGMTFESDAVLDEGMSLHLRLSLPLDIRGEVRHSRPSVSQGKYRYGVRFHKIDAPEGSSN